jgi:23S rRNA (cytidine1920-2'-O)/16S rRNA (cytidine1409-2'-O)-methyltransferase
MDVPEFFAESLLFPPYEIVFNTSVENAVQSTPSCSLRGSFFDGFTLCTLLRAGTSVVRCPGRPVGEQAPISKMKIRLDKLLVERGLSSRERAQALILAGKVLVNGQKVEKAGAAVEGDSEIRFLGEDLKYVSRGGLKLEKALDHWRIKVTNKTCLDIGASTGGFTDCLLQRGASHVIAVDTGYGQMDFRLRQDNRVRLLEKTNARYLTSQQVGEIIDLIVMDVSFISATLVLPAVVSAGFAEAKSGRNLIVLVKPQFEVGRALVGKGGIVRDEKAQAGAVEKVTQSVANLGFSEIDVIESPILGAEGNREFLLHAVR